MGEDIDMLYGEFEGTPQYEYVYDGGDVDAGEPETND